MCHRRDLAEYADGRLRKAVGGRTNVTFVGVHVRRTDYAHHVKVRAPYKWISNRRPHAESLCKDKWCQLGVRIVISGPRKAAKTSAQGVNQVLLHSKVKFTLFPACK